MSFFDDASLAFLPSGAAGKDGKAYSIKPTDGTGDFTFSRGSNLAATRVGADGLIEKGRENLLKQSNAFSTSPWTDVTASVTSGQSGYDGSSDAWLLEKSGASGRILQSISAVSGVYTYSIYAKQGSSSSILLLLDASTDAYAYFDLSAGTLLSNSNIIDGYITDAGNGWYRVSVLVNISSFDRIRIYPAQGADTSATSGSIYIQDAQVEIGLAATPYIESGATTGKAGLLEDEPRFDYSGGATCPSLLLEPSRTQLVKYSEYIEEADQISDTQILTTTDATPEGTNNARVLAYNGGTNQHYIAFVPSVTNGNTYTFSVFLKKKELRYVALIFLNDYSGRFFDLETGTILGTTGSTPIDSKIEDYGNGWYRCSITDVATSTSKFSGVYLSGNGTALGPFVPTGNDGVYIYGYQLEEGSYPTSYIPNHSGGTITRGADAASVTGASSLIGQSEGTFYVDFEYLDGQSSANENWFALESDDGNQRVLWYKGSTPKQRFLLQANGTSVFSNSSLIDPLVAGARYKMAVRYNSGDIAIYINGSQIATDTSTYTMSTNLNKVDFNESLQALSSRFNQMLVFTEGLSNADLATLTTI